MQELAPDAQLLEEIQTLTEQLKRLQEAKALDEAEMAVLQKQLQQSNAVLCKTIQEKSEVDAELREAVLKLEHHEEEKFAMQGMIEPLNMEMGGVQRGQVSYLRPPAEGQLLI